MNIGFLERVYLRGLEGMVSDRYLGNFAFDNTTEGHLGVTDELDSYMQSKYIAIQLFFQMKGWGLR